MITSLSACPITFPLNPLLKRWPIMSPTLLNSLLQLQNISQGSDIFSQIYILTLTLIMPTHWSLQLFEGQRKSVLTQSIISCPCILLIYKPFYILPMAHSLMMTSFLLPSCPAFSIPATILASWCRKNSKDLFDWQKIIKCSSLTFPPGQAQYHLPYHKGDPFYHGTDILFSHQEVADPVTLLHEYVKQCDSVHGAHLALFLREDSSHPTRSWFDAQFLQCSAMNLVDTLPTQVVPHFMPVLDSPRTSFKLLAIGLLKHGRFTSETTPLFMLSSSWLLLDSIYDAINKISMLPTSIISHHHHPTTTSTPHH